MATEFISGYKTSKGSFINRALWWCAGGDPILLDKGTYTDQIKIACMGGTVLSTAILATLAGTYAFHTIFSDDPNAGISYVDCLFGIVWGMIIFNIDRFIVSSTQPKVKDKGFLETAKTAVPRIVMGIIISLIISKPLELKIFEKDIELAIAKTKEEKFLEIKDATRGKFKNEETILEGKISKFDKQILDLEKQRDKYDSLFQVEARIVTVGPRAQAMQKGRDDAEQKISEIKSSEEYIALQKEKDDLFEKINKNAEIERKSVDLGMRSLVSKIKLSHEISPVISNMITILFIILELTPIIFKLLMETSPIDFLMHNRNEVIKAQNLIENTKEEDFNIRSIAAENLLSRLKTQDEKLNDRLFKEFDEDNKKKESNNLKINETKNQKYLNDNIVLIDIEQDKKIKQNQYEYTLNKEEEKRKLDELNTEKEINFDKLQKFKINEVDLNEFTIEEYKKVEKQNIAVNPEEAFTKRFPYIEKTVSDVVDTKNKNIAEKAEELSYRDDDLIKNQKWIKDKSAFVKVFNRETLQNDFSIPAERVNEAYHDEANKALTDVRITMSKKHDNLKRVGL